jgi:tetratricopeptide (TPR) repeat protein
MLRLQIGKEMTSDQLIQYLKAPGLLNQQTLPHLQELTERYPGFETGWMLYLKNLKNISDASFEQELINGAIRIQNRRKLYLFLNHSDDQTDQVTTDLASPIKDEVYDLIFPTEYRLEENTEEPVQKIASSIPHKPGKGVRLIDKFLEAQPKMPQIKDVESASPAERKTTQEDVNEDFVTETLASIYAQQGYYKKAVQIFEKLSLKYPEKSTYFAAQIEKVKHLMNN